MTDDRAEAAAESSGSAIAGAIKVEVRRNFNDLEGKRLDARARYIDRWLLVVALVLTFFGVVITVGGFFGVRIFRDVVAEARKSVEKADNVVAKAEERLVEAEQSLEKIGYYELRAQQLVGQMEGNSKDIDGALTEILRNRRSLHVLVRQVSKTVEDGNTFEGHKKRGDRDLGLEEYPAAVRAYDEALKLKRDPVVYKNRGNAKAALEQYGDAIKDYDEALKLKRDPVVYKNRGNAKAALEQYGDAVKDYDEALKLKNDFASVFYDRGKAKIELKRPGEAKNDFDQARQLALEANNTTLAALANRAWRELAVTSKSPSLSQWKSSASPITKGRLPRPSRAPFAPWRFQSLP